MRFFLFCFAVSVTVGCADPNVNKMDAQLLVRNGVHRNVYEWQYKNHIYLVIGDSDSGYSVCHAGHCKCGSK